MLTLEEIKLSILSLSKNEYFTLRNWILEKDWEKWDKEIEEDSKNGKLDVLIMEAFNEKKREI